MLRKKDKFNMITENNINILKNKKYWGLLQRSKLALNTPSIYYLAYDKSEGSASKKGLKISIEIQKELIQYFSDYEYILCTFDESTNHNIKRTSDMTLFTVDTFSKYVKILGGEVNESKKSWEWTFSFNLDNGKINELVSKIAKKVYGENTFEQKKLKQVTSKNQIEQKNENPTKGVQDLNDEKEHVMKLSERLILDSSALKNQLKNIEEDIQKLNNIKNDLIKENKQLNEKNSNLKNDLMNSEEEYKKTENKLLEYKTKVDTYKNEITQLEKAKIKNQEENKKESRMIENLVADLKGYVNEIKKGEMSKSLLPLFNIINADSKITETSIRTFNPLEYLETSFPDKCLEYFKDANEKLTVNKIEKTRKIKENYDIEFRKRIKNSGLFYEDNIHNHLFETVSSNRLAILCGNPGYGKSKLVELFIDSMNTAVFGKDHEFNSLTYSFIPVKPDWIDPSYLLGTYNYLTGEPEITDFVKILYLANKFKNLDFYVLFDEFNLARPENYFAPFLSLLELNEANEKRKILIWSRNITSDKKDYHIKINNNIHFLATINEDSSTVELSPKVKDRSDIILIKPTKSSYDKYLKLKEIDKTNGIKDSLLSIFSNCWWKIYKTAPFSFRVLSTLNKTQLSDDMFAYRLLTNLPHQNDSDKFKEFINKFEGSLTPQQKMELDKSLKLLKDYESRISILL